MLEYGTVPLTPANEQLKALIENRITTDDVYEFSAMTWPDFRESAWAVADARPQRQRVLLGRLSWPWGASRFSVGHYLVSGKNLDLIRQKATANNAFNKLKLHIASENSSQFKIKTDMYMLPARPLFDVLPRDRSVEQSLHLLTLVDERFFWWRKASNIAVTGGTTTWANMFSNIATALGITITTDTIDSDYLKPPQGLVSNHRYLPLLLDACCESVGHRFIHNHDGNTFTTQTAGTAKAKQDDQLTKWQKSAGGQFALKSTLA